MKNYYFIHIFISLFLFSFSVYAIQIYSEPGSSSATYDPSEEDTPSPTWLEEIFIRNLTDEQKQQFVQPLILKDTNQTDQNVEKEINKRRNRRLSLDEKFSSMSPRRLVQKIEQLSESMSKVRHEIGSSWRYINRRFTDTNIPTHELIKHKKLLKEKCTLAINVYDEIYVLQNISTRNSNNSRYKSITNISYSESLLSTISNVRESCREGSFAIDLAMEMPVSGQQLQGILRSMSSLTNVGQNVCTYITTPRMVQLKSGCNNKKFCLATIGCTEFYTEFESPSFNNKSSILCEIDTHAKKCPSAQQCAKNQSLQKVIINEQDNATRSSNSAVKSTESQAVQ